MGSYLGSLFQKKDPRTPVKGFAPKIKSFLRCHARTMIACIVPLAALIPQAEKANHAKTVQLMWIWMFWFFLLQPVDLPVTSMIPIFMLPMCGAVGSLAVCNCYFNETIALLILGQMLLLLMNNSGVDRRIMLWLICSGDNCQFSGKRLVFKFSTAAFFMSMFSNRLIITSALTQYITPALVDLHSALGSSKVDPNYNEMRYIITNAIQTSSAIGSTAIVHASFATLVFRAVFIESPGKGKEYEDIFNYMQYSAFAFPVALIQFMINFGYHMILINKCAGVTMPASSMTELRKSLIKLKSTLPKRVTLHEKFTVFFSIVVLFVFIFRWCPWLNMGWASYNKVEAGEKFLPIIKDSTVAAMFVVLLHILPKGYGFVDYLNADKKSQLPPLKPESAILWWKFVDKNLNYGYIFLIGGAVALCTGVNITGLGPIVAANIGKIFSSYGWNTNIFLVCLISASMANFMSGVAVVVILMPIVLNLAVAPTMRDDVAAPSPWLTQSYLGALAVGLCGSYSFMIPFVYTPGYVSKSTGKIPILKMMKYSFCSVLICLIVLWLSILHWAPVVWGSDGFSALSKEAAADAGGGATSVAGAAAGGTSTAAAGTTP